MLLFAEATPEVAKGISDVLLQQGPLGAICLLLVGALAYISKALIKAKDDRTADAKEAADRLQSTKAQADSLSKERGKAHDDMFADAIRTSERHTAALKSLEDQQRELRTSIDKLREQQGDVETAMVGLKEAHRR